MHACRAVRACMRACMRACLRACPELPVHVVRTAVHDPAATRGRFAGSPGQDATPAQLPKRQRSATPPQREGAPLQERRSAIPVDPRPPAVKDRIHKIAKIRGTAARSATEWPPSPEAERGREEGRRSNRARSLEVQVLDPILGSLDEDDAAPACPREHAGPFDSAAQVAAEKVVAPVSEPLARVNVPEAPELGTGMSGQTFLKSKETVREVNVFLESWVGRLSAELRDTVNKCPPDERAGILRELDNLSDVAQHARRALVVGEIAMDANCGWEKFRRTFNPRPAPKDHTHQAWTQGTNSSGGQLRVLLPLDRVLEIFRNVSYADYAGNGGIVTAVGNITPTQAYHLKDGRLEEVELATVNQGKVAIKMIEVRLDYECVMERLQFRCIAKPKGENEEVTRRAHEKQVTEDCMAWADYLLKEKQRQANTVDRRNWPTEPRAWGFRDVLTMPVVIWITKTNKIWITKHKK
jgi:hypothetical protein